MKMEITSEQREFLIGLLEEHRRELIREIARAGHLDFRTRLRDKTQLLETILDQVAAAEAV
jgi:hypothetical protein